MPLNLNISIEQLAETFRKLSKSDRARLKTLLGEEWFEFKSDEDTKTIHELLKISQKQHQEGKSRHFENIIEDSKKKYGL
jgi:glucosamine 6-phosphate synthetase-like amidotransferase/phosphosugar isomerase protein